MVVRKITPCMEECQGFAGIPGAFPVKCLPAVCSGPRPDLTFVYTTHCKSRINNMYSEKQVWISRASRPLGIHIYKILLQ